VGNFHSSSTTLNSDLPQNLAEQYSKNSQKWTPSSLALGFYGQFPWDFAVCPGPIPSCSSCLSGLEESSPCLGAVMLMFCNQMHSNRDLFS
jgi:hypothetical protein